MIVPLRLHPPIIQLVEAYAAKYTFVDILLVTKPSTTTNGSDTIPTNDIV